MKQTKLILMALPLLLAACSDARETLGLGRAAPDEFAVVDRPPLVIPPDFTLRPPQPGVAPTVATEDVSRRAAANVFGTSVQQTEDVGALEDQVLQQAGAKAVDPAVRADIDREAQARDSANRHLVDELLWWKRDSSGDAVIDPEAERKRLEDAKTKGENPTAAPTPVIEKNKSGWLGL